MAASFAFAMPVHAQSPLDGPLATPPAAEAPLAKAKTKATTKPRKLRHAAVKGDKIPASAADAPRPTSAEEPAHAAAPTDALDLGMKWNGSNDGSAETKFQSGPNTSPGSGAEVGMKLHF